MDFAPLGKDDSEEGVPRPGEEGFFDVETEVVEFDGWGGRTCQGLANGVDVRVEAGKVSGELGRGHGVLLGY